MANLLQSRETFEEQYERVADWLESLGDATHAARIRDILHDLSTSQATLTVAFCGLFSAGKSSLINALAESSSLATGAVPTTAQVTSVPMADTQGEILLLDTPGVDSTDDSHREATMNALYRADVVLLVADYHHVEAEENLELLRGFLDEGKRIGFVVNQIDKHLDFELSFADFANGVAELLTLYGLDEQDIFYTTNGLSPYNQIGELKQWLKAFVQSGEDSSAGEQSAMKRVVDVARDAVRLQFDAPLQETKAEIQSKFDALPMDVAEAKQWLEVEQASLRNQVELLREKAEDSSQRLNTMRETFLRTVELAQISPYETTEKGRLFAESMRADFKVGVFRSARKTQEAQSSRALAFAEDLNQRTQNYLLIPLRNQLTEQITALSIDAAQVAEQVSLLQLIVDEAYVRNVLKPGALVSTQYPYQYVKDVVSRIKREILGQLTRMLDTWFDQVTSSFDEANGREQENIQVSKARIAALEAYLTLETQLSEAICHIQAGEVPSL